MTESFLYYVWQFKRFSSEALLTVDGKAIQVEKTGFRNYDAGPDFFDARLRIDGTLWAGNVEMHLRSSDWNKHKHYEDKAYNNTILHIVFIHDCEVLTEDGRQLPCLALKDYIAPSFLNYYQSFIGSQKAIACQDHLKDIDSFVWIHWLNTLAVERLSSKTEGVMTMLANCKNDWHTALLSYVATYLGGKTNQLAFQILLRSIPSTVIIKHQHSLLQTEALLFGQAGLLEADIDEPYHKSLNAEYQFLKAKYKLVSMPPHMWKYLRMRPSSFPDVRIAQLAQLLHHSEHLFARVLSAKDIERLKCLFDVTATAYWDIHYRFGKESSKRISKRIGKNTQHSIIINAVIPFLFVYGDQQQKEELKQRALYFLEQMPFESNKVTKLFLDLGQRHSNALHSQAVLQLKTVYCDAKKCLECSLGHQILKCR